MGACSKRQKDTERQQLIWQCKRHSNLNGIKYVGQTPNVFPCLTGFQIFLRAIGANWLVCMAVFLSISAREIASKIIAIWFPTACFVGLALDHVVANMFFIPIGIWCGAPFSVGYYIWKSMIPTGTI
jgi:hypothetical protein